MGRSEINMDNVEDSFIALQNAKKSRSTSAFKEAFARGE